METLILREEPPYRIFITQNSFEINDSEYEKNNGVYIFSEIKSLKLERKTNWLISSLSLAADFLLSAGSFDLYNNPFQLSFTYEGRLLEITLKGCNTELAQQTVDRIIQKIDVNIK